MTGASEELKSGREALLRGLSGGKCDPDFPERNTELVDQYFRRSLQDSPIGRALFKERCPVAFVAVGGYGRAELCLHSDIDILILFGRKVPTSAKNLSDEVFFPLWDLGLDLGYVVRTVADCVKLAKDDFQVLTSLLDARFLCGDSPLYLGLLAKLQDKVLCKRARTFSRWLEDQTKIREMTYGDASYLLEPNLKEGLGGLRDYHAMLWLGKVFFELRVPRDLEYQGRLSNAEFQTLEADLDLIRRTRNLLHFLTGRKNDRLSFEYQEKIAGMLGFRDLVHSAAVEQFMGRLHAAMGSIKSLHRAFLRTHLPKGGPSRKDAGLETLKPGLHVEGDAVCFDGAMAILARPLLLMEIFEESSRLGFPLSMEARRLVREFSYLVNDAYRSAPEPVERFLGIVESRQGQHALDEMFETGFLDVFIPELGRTRDKVQFDAYHIYPVGRHVLQTVACLKTIGRQSDILLTTIFKEAADKRGLLLAALFHDIGKGGPEHALRGAQITRAILDRFDYPMKAGEDILFLVRNHLLLVEIATRRDLNDEKVVVQCARGMGSIERLKMLYLLTWADSMATGPRAWTDWIANLVRELFFKILHILEKGELASADASRRVEATRLELRQRLSAGMDPEAIDGLTESMAPRYLLERNPVEILRDVDAVLAMRGAQGEGLKDSFAVAARKDEMEDCWEITFAARDRPGLFADMAGVLALENINVLSAYIYTWRDGTAVDIFKVTNPLDPLRAGEIWERVEEDLRKTFSGRLSLGLRLDEKASPSIVTGGRKPAQPPKVNVDNRASDFFTIVEVFADDRIGLLYRITHTLFNLKLDIRIAKIATKGDQIADVFYVRDLEGQKVEDPERVEEISGALLHELAD